MTIDPRLHRIVAAQPYPLLFATISGAHLYGFPSPDSDFDLRGAHVLPLEKIVGLDVRDETVEQSFVVPPHPLRKEVISPDNPHPASPPSPAPAGEGECAEGRALEMDIVSHDVRKFFGLLLRSLLENSKGRCGEGFWLWARRRSPRIPTAVRTEPTKPTGKRPAARRVWFF